MEHKLFILNRSIPPLIFLNNADNHRKSYGFERGGDIHEE